MNGHLAPAMYSVLESWYDFFQANHRDSMPHAIGKSVFLRCSVLLVSFNLRCGVVYLHVTPAVAYQRMLTRARVEESGVSIAYLDQLDNLHTDWLSRVQEANMNEDSDLPVRMRNIIMGHNNFQILLVG